MSEQQERSLLYRDRIFVWQSAEGKDGVRYGCYRTVTREELARRRHRIEFWDGAVSILWLEGVPT